MKKIAALFLVLALLAFVGAVEAATDGAAIFKERCSTCHGVNADTPRGNATGGIRAYEAAVVLQKLDGYAAGTYGGSQKATMQKMASGLSAEERKAVADYVGSLK